MLDPPISVERQLGYEAPQLLTVDPTNNKRVVISTVHLSGLLMEDKSELVKEGEKNPKTKPTAKTQTKQTKTHTIK